MRGRGPQASGRRSRQLRSHNTLVARNLLELREHVFETF